MSDLLQPLAPDDVFVTDQLRRRPPRKTDYLEEKRALQDLARQMVDHPADILPRLVDLAMEITGSSSAGISQFEEFPAPSVFRWHYVRGKLAGFDGATTPRDFSPCGVTLDRGEPTLSQRPERVYGWIAEANIVVPELLLVPLYVNGGLPLGTLWIVAEREGYFDSGHARVLTELAGFAGIALHRLGTEQRLKQALEKQEFLTREQEILTEEMSHRVKNLFTVAIGMINASARSASTPEEMADILSGRLRALSDANALVRRSFGHTETLAEGTELAEVVRKILLPHEDAPSSVAFSRFKIEGQPVWLGERTNYSFALILHELATNAAKYGALVGDESFVSVSWREAGEQLEVTWREHGGPIIEAAPTKTGFGSMLAKRTIVGQLKGTLFYDWQPHGLCVTMSVPLKNLQV